VIAVIRRRRTPRVAVLAAVALMVVGALLPSDFAHAAVTSSRAGAAPAAESNGYAWVSYYRGLAGLAGVRRSAAMEAQEAAHVRYLANHALPCERNVHDELTTRVGGCGPNRASTSGGRAAANNSNVTRVSAQVSDRVAVSNWFSAAFHALVLLDPRLTTTGYAAYYTSHPAGASPLAWKFTAAVDVYRGRYGSYNGSVVAFPANNAVSPLLSYTVGTESPEPFRSSPSSCEGWGRRSVVSAPVIVQWPVSGRSGSPSAGSIVDVTSGRRMSTCTLTSRSYPSGSLPAQFLGGANGLTRVGLYYASTPFLSGHRYQLRLGSGAVTTFTARSSVGPMVTSNALPADRSRPMAWAGMSDGLGLLG
jgi:hypothetical protein